MKLTNKQLTIIANRIHQQISASNQDTIRKQKEKLIADATKRTMKHPVFKLVQSINTKYCDWLKIYDRILKEIAWYPETNDISSYSYRYTTSIKSTGDLIEQVSKIVATNIQTNVPSFNKIEEELVMSSVNSKDLEALIKTVTDKFSK